MPKTRVLVLHEALTSYRLPMFRALARSPAHSFEFILGSVDAEVAADETGLGLVSTDLGGRSQLERARLVWDATSSLSSRYDIIILNDHIGFPELTLDLRARIHRVPMIRWVESTADSIDGLSLIHSTAKAAISRLTRTFIVTSSSAASYVASTAPDAVIHRCHNVVDNDLFEATQSVSADQRRDLLNKLGLVEPVIFYCGQLIERKGLSVLLEALDRMPSQIPCSILLAGDGPLRAHLRDRLADLSFPAALVGQIAYDQLPLYYSIADIAVLPSFVDIWGMVVNEAMAAGVPVVCSDGAGASRDLIRHGETGMVFQRGDADALASCFSRLATDSELRSTMATSATEQLRDYSVEKACRQFLEAIDMASRERKSYDS